ncbi:MAG: S1C family serine protease [Patescibacteria group bacterium]|jgi:hypothetical protein
MIKRFKDKSLLVVGLLVLVALIAGFLGALLASYWGRGSNYPFLYSGELNLGALNPSQSSLIIREPKKVIVNQDVKTEETLQAINSSLVSVFKAKTISPAAQINEEEYYFLEEPDLVGLAVTSDGWVMAAVAEELVEDSLISDYLAITSDRKIYQIDKVQPATIAEPGIVFFHLTEASNLPVRKIAPRADLAQGQTLLAIDNARNVWPTSLAAFKKSNSVLSSDHPQAFISLANELESSQQNAYLFNLAGDLVAIIDSQQTIIPAFIYHNYWVGLKAEGEFPLRPQLGVNYLNLAAVEVRGISLNKGALIYPATDQVAVIPDSPAAEAGLQAGDIITWVNNQELSSANDLADLISEYKANDKITLSYLRAGVENRVDLRLGALKLAD